MARGTARRLGPPRALLLPGTLDLVDRVLRPALQLSTAIQLASLMYSDKKLGDVPTRQVIAELSHILFELYPIPAPLLPLTPTVMATLAPRRPRHLSRLQSPESQSTLPHPYTTAFSLLRSILFTPKPAATESLSTPVGPFSHFVPRGYASVLLPTLHRDCRGLEYMLYPCLLGVYLYHSACLSKPPVVRSDIFTFDPKKRNRSISRLAPLFRTNSPNPP